MSLSSISSSVADAGEGGGAGPVAGAPLAQPATRASGKTTLASACITRLRPVQLREPLLELPQLGQIVVHDVRLGGVTGQIVLMIALRRIEVLQRHHLRHDRPG